ncbi:cytochrome P450 4V2-like isoform X2 [Rhodnius prolixus]
MLFVIFAFNKASDSNLKKKMFDLIITVAVTFIVYHLLIAAYSYCRVLKIVKNIPTLPSIPFLGVALQFYKIKSPNGMIEVLSPCLQSSPQKIIKCWIGPKIVVCLLNPKYIEIVLSSKDALDRDSVYKILHIYGSGLFTENGKKWKELRKPLHKVLSSKAVESYFHFFQESAVKFCKFLQQYAVTGEKLDLKHGITNFSVDLLSACTLGYETNEMFNSKLTVGKCASEILYSATKMMHTPHYIVFNSLIPYGADGRNLIKSSKEMWSFVGSILKGRMNEIVSPEENDITNPQFYSDFLIQKGKEYGLSHEELARLATDYVMAGFDAPAVMSAATLMMLAMNPEHEEAVYREQVEILGDDLSVLPSENDLSKMHYLNRVIKETLRIFSPVTILRTTKNDIILDEQFTLPKGCSVYISIHDLHRDPSNWSHPHEFYPDHFLPKEVAKRPKGAYIPFSWGPRSCPGPQFANVEMRVLLSRVIREYKFETDLKLDKLSYKYSLLIEPAEGFMMKVVSRNLQEKKK